MEEGSIMDFTRPLSDPLNSAASVIISQNVERSTLLTCAISDGCKRPTSSAYSLSKAQWTSFGKWNIFFAIFEVSLSEMSSITAASNLLFFCEANPKIFFLGSCVYFRCTNSQQKSISISYPRMLVQSPLFIFSPKRMALVRRFEVVSASSWPR